MTVASAWRRAAVRVAWRAVTLGLGGCLLASCSTQEAADRAARPEPTATASTRAPADSAGRSPAPTRRPGRDDRSRPRPTAPTARSATTLARQIDQAVAAVRDRGATAAGVRRAAEFQQLAVHALAEASDAVRRRVTARLRPDVARAVRSDVRASRALQALSDPQPRLPDWRIVAPPPPRELLGHYRRAQRRTGVPWTYLAAVHLVETRMGRIRGTSTAGAVGPMQFLPSTWDVYGGDGDIRDPGDAILAAARLLRANGAPDDMSEALWHYNPSDNYVRAITEHARAVQRSRTAYRGYWHWRVLYNHEHGTYVLPVGYPDTRPVLLHAH